MIIARSVLALFVFALSACITGSGGTHESSSTVPTGDAAVMAAPAPGANIAHDEAAFLKDVAARTLGEGGATADLRARALVGKRDAFAVSRRGGEAVSAETDVETLATIIGQFADKKADDLAAVDAFLGTWKSPDGKVYLDVTVLVPYAGGDRDEVLQDAIAIAQKEGQQAIYDLGRGEDVSVPPADH